MQTVDYVCRFLRWKGQRKEKIALPYLEFAAKEGQERVVLLGSAPEKASIWKSWPRQGREKAAYPHMDWGRQMGYIDHFYFSLWDREWGGSFGKTDA